MRGIIAREGFSPEDRRLRRMLAGGSRGRGEPIATFRLGVREDDLAGL